MDGSWFGKLCMLLQVSVDARYKNINSDSFLLIVLELIQWLTTFACDSPFDLLASLIQCLLSGNVK